MKRKITIVGLGPGDEDYLTLGALKALKSGEVILRTENHGALPFLKDQGIQFTSLDDIYESSDTFEAAYEAMVHRIEEKALEEDMILAVPGHPMIGERLVLELLTKLDRDTFSIDIIPGIGRAEAVLAALGDVHSPQGVKILMASDMEIEDIDNNIGQVVLDINSYLLASEIKLRLLRSYPPEHDVYLWEEDSDGELKYDKISLYEMDKPRSFNHTTCLYIPPVELKDLENYDLRDLVKIMGILRGKGGCDWDREQTHRSLKEFLVEEAYEVLEAIDMEDYGKIIEELGDVLLQIVFHSQIGKEHGEFDMRDVTTAICQKMIKRHPQIFGTGPVLDPDEGIGSWEAMKKEEKGLKSHTQILQDIPSNLPALMRANKVQYKASLVGFDWDHVESAMEKVEEELGELRGAYVSGNEQAIYEELGDLLFSVVNVARFLEIQPELSLGASIEKFIRRFEFIETNSPTPLEETSLENMETLWNQAKSLHS